jgi:hypothetical protein
MQILQIKILQAADYGHSPVDNKRTENLAG